MARTKKQLQVPGTERDHIAEVDTAAESYIEARDERMDLTEKESEAKEALLSVMKKHRLDVYRDENVVPPLVVTLIPGSDDVKVKRVKNADGEGEELEGDRR
jgi:hypothetical protein